MIFLIFEFFHAQIQLDCHEQQLLVRAVINMEKKNWKELWASHATIGAHNKL